MHKNTFLPTPEVKQIIFKDLILVVWKYAQMQKKHFSTTSDVKKSLSSGLDSGGLEVCANALKHDVNHPRRL